MSNEGKQSGDAGAFDGAGKLPLVFRANTRVPRIDNFRLTGNKPAQCFDIPMINFFRVLRTENALLSFFLHRSRDSLKRNVFGFNVAFV